MPMPPRQKRPTRLSLTIFGVSWRDGASDSKKSLLGREPQGEFVGPKTFTGCASDCFNWGQEPKSKKRLAGIYFLECDVKAFSMQRTM